MRVLIIPDKFKGTLTAREAAEAMAGGWREQRPADELDLLPMSDGGDGFGEILGELLGASAQESLTVNAAHEPITARWWWSETRHTAIVESARVIGLAMLPPGKFHPFELDTFGLGELLHVIGHAHPKARLILGIGGSATNDAGFGMARALGFRFVDTNGNLLERWTHLDRLARIEPPGGIKDFSDVTIACDVQNSLLGPAGASRVYGPQKGLRPEDFATADRAFERLTTVVQTDVGKNCATDAGAGAAGGLGYGLRVFADGRFQPGFEIFAEAAGLPGRIAAADLVITGEGCIDEQTEMGKGTGAITQLARASGKRCIGLAGYLPKMPTRALFEFTLGIAPEFTTIEDAQRQAGPWLAKISREAAKRVV